MTEGYVYILMNPMIEGVVKIGRTVRSSEERAKEISSATGVPTPYIVVHEEYVVDCEAVEARLHQKFTSFRVTPDREFFRLPLKDAVRALYEITREFQPAGSLLDPYPPTQAVEISVQLRARYGAYIRPNIVSVKLVNSSGTCFLEVRSRKYPHSLDETIERTDLAFISELDDGPMFTPSRSADENAQKFLKDLDPYSIIICTNLFTPEAAAEVAAKYDSGAG